MSSWKLDTLFEWFMVYIMNIIFAPEKLEELKRMDYPSKDNFLGMKEWADDTDHTYDGMVIDLLSASDNPFSDDVINRVRMIIGEALLEGERKWLRKNLQIPYARSID